MVMQIRSNYSRYLLKMRFEQLRHPSFKNVKILISDFD